MQGNPSTARADSNGIPGYIANKLARARTADPDTYRAKTLKAYKELLEALEWVSERITNDSFHKQDDSQSAIALRRALISAEFPERPGVILSKYYKLVRNDCYERALATGTPLALARYCALKNNCRFALRFRVPSRGSLQMLKERLSVGLNTRVRVDRYVSRSATTNAAIPTSTKNHPQQR